MKKILLLILTIIILTPVCFAQEEEEDINSYFEEEIQSGETVAESPTVLDGYAEYNQGLQEQDAVELDSAGTRGINFTMPQKIESKSLITNLKKPSFKPIQDEFEAASKFSAQEYDISPVSTAYSRKFGKFSLGTKYDSFISGARANYSTGIFAKYEGKYWALTSTLAKKTSNAYSSYNDTIMIAPELKLTKRLSLLDVMKTDVYQINKSNQIILRYKPHLGKYADDVQFELGAGQTFYEDSYVNSSVTFSTQFKL